MIDYHLRCYRCGYDLYSLENKDSCPECGASILLTFCDVAARAKSVPFGLVDDPLHTKLGLVAAHTPRTLDAVIFLWFAHHFYIEAIREANDPPILPGNTSVDARSLCQSIRDLAAVEFGDAAPQRLKKWSLATRDQVGAFVDDMTRFGAFKTMPGEAKDDFSCETCPDPASFA